MLNLCDREAWAFGRFCSDVHCQDFTDKPLIFLRPNSHSHLFFILQVVLQSCSSCEQIKVCVVP